MQASQKVNTIGRYLYKHIESAYDFKKSANMFDIYFTVYYQLSEENRYEDVTDNDFHEMNINMNITTYQNKIRINIIEISPRETTIGYDLYTPEKLENLSEAYNLIWSRFIKRMNKYYKDYDFIF